MIIKCFVIILIIITSGCSCILKKKKYWLTYYLPEDSLEYAKMLPPGCEDQLHLCYGFTYRMYHCNEWKKHPDSIRGIIIGNGLRITDLIGNLPKIKEIQDGINIYRYRNLVQYDTFFNKLTGIRLMMDSFYSFQDSDTSQLEWLNLTCDYIDPGSLNATKMNNLKSLSINYLNVEILENILTLNQLERFHFSCHLEDSAAMKMLYREPRKFEIKAENLYINEIDIDTINSIILNYGSKFIKVFVILNQESDIKRLIDRMKTEYGLEYIYEYTVFNKKAVLFFIDDFIRSRIRRMQNYRN